MPKPTTLNIIESDNPQSRYAYKQLSLALSKLDGKYKINTVVDADGFLSISRIIESAKDGTFDVVWTATNKDIEKKLIPIRIPLYKGLLGHRVLLVHQDNKRLFENINSINQLKNFSFGQGTGWSDTEILKSNGLTVVETPKWAGLFHMTDGKRFHAYPRGIQEPWEELNLFSELDLAVEEHIMMVYLMPFYFFVSQEQAELAADIEKGLNIAIEDGSFDKLFYAEEMVINVAKNANMANRKVFKLDNPSLSDKTPIDRKVLWVDKDEFYSSNPLAGN